MQVWAETAVYSTIAYSAIGVLFGALFVTRGAARVDPSAAGAGWGFRLVILPAVVALWPLLLRRWLQAGQGPPTEVNAHRRASR